MLFRRVTVSIAWTTGSEGAVYLGKVDGIMDKAFGILGAHDFMPQWSSAVTVSVRMSGDETLSTQVDFSDATDLRTSGQGASHGAIFQASDVGGVDGRGQPSYGGNGNTVIGMLVTAEKLQLRGERYILTSKTIMAGGVGITVECSNKETPPLYTGTGIFEIHFDPHAPSVEAMGLPVRNAGSYSVGNSYSALWARTGIPFVRACQ